MKILLVLFIVLSSHIAWGVFDPPHEQVIFKLDHEILRDGAYISLVNNYALPEIYDEYTIQEINTKTESYSFMFPERNSSVKIKFNDSTEEILQIPNAVHRMSYYKISINNEKQLVIKDITNYYDSEYALKFLALASFILLLIKILPALLIISPKSFWVFIKSYGFVQILYCLIFSILIYLFKGTGLFFSVLFLAAALAIDHKILRKLYLEKYTAITISTIVAIVLTIIFTICLYVGYTILLFTNTTI